MHFRSSRFFSYQRDHPREKRHASPDDDAGILAGQWLPYLNYTMADFTSDRREMPKKMKKKVEKLSAEDIEAVMHFLASQK